MVFIFYKRWLNLTKFLIILVGVYFTFYSPAATAQGKWTVTRKKDEMTGVSKARACVNSTNSVKQDFPYGEGRTTARLCLLRDPSGVESMVAINQGQLMCDLGNATFLLKIDDLDPDNMSCVGTTSNDSDVAYFSEGADAVGKIIKSIKIIRIETTLYNHGDVVFRFPPLSKVLAKEFEIFK